MNPIWIILIIFGVGLSAIIYFGVKSAKKSKLPSVDDRKPIYKMSKRKLRRMQRQG